MPQLVPFYFLNQLTYGLSLVTIIIVLASKTILPIILRHYMARLLITRI